MKNLVIVPTYNEKENIEALIIAVLKHHDYSVLVVDDNSPDGTAAIVKDLMSRYKDRLFILEREKKLGLGTAYILGFKFGLQHGYDLIYEMDADFSHNPNDLPRLRKAITQGADVAVGSRYVKGGGLVNWPRNRIFISRAGSAYVQVLTSMPIKDPTAGFICYKAKILRSINLDKIEFKGYAFQIEMKYVFWKMGFQIVEVPIIFKDRELGTSKMSSNIIHEAVKGVVKMRLRNVKKHYGL